MSVGVGQPVGGGVLRASEVWERIRARIEHKLLHVDRTVCARFQRSLTTVECREAHDLCDALATWLGRLGLPEAAELARQLRDGFDRDEPAPALASLCDDMRTMLAINAAGVDASERDGALLLVIGPATAVVDSVLWVACMHGLRVAHGSRALPNLAEAPQCVYLAFDDQVARPTLRAAFEQFPGVPIVATTPELDIEDEIDVARYVHALVPAGTSPIDIVAQARGLALRRALPNRLAVAGSLTEIAEQLSARDVAAQAYDDLPAVMTALRAGEARAALAVDGESIDPLALLQLVRSDPHLRNVPVSAITDQGEARRSQLLRAGADDVWPTTLSLDELATACANRLRRAGDTSQVFDFDQPVASVSEAHATLLIERMLVAAFRRSSTVAVGVVRGGDAPEYAERLAREFRREDVVGRFENSLIVALQGVGRATAIRRFEGIVRRLDVQALETRVGVAEYPIDGSSLDDLIAAANDAI
ncbi:MAG TPA: hypothetical protein VFR41_06250, partial [Acidimicrobiia bacterium]|nr:hypothetical protein [Acidimicrobiia bacterium]